MHPPCIPITPGIPSPIGHLDELKGLWKAIAKGCLEVHGQGRGAYHGRKIGWHDENETL